MPIAITNRTEKGSPLLQSEMDYDILERMVDFMNALEALMFISLNPDGTLKNIGFFQGVSTNGTDSYTATVAGVSAQSDLLGKLLILKVDVANAGPSSLNVSPTVGAPFGASPIVRFQDVALESNVIKANKYVFLTWDGTNYIMQSFPGVTMPVNYGLDTGAVNAMVVAQSGYIEVPATLYPGYCIFVKPAITNTSATTLTLGALPAVTLKRQSGVDVFPGDVTVGRVIQCIYDGTNFIVPALGGPVSMVPWLDGSTLAARINSTITTPHGLGAKPEILRVVLLCSVIDGTYAVGDEISVESVQQNDGDSAFVTLVDATNIYVVVSPEAGDFKTQKKDGSGSTILTNANWNVKMYASRL